MAGVRVSAVKWVTEEHVLKQIYFQDKSEDVRNFAFAQRLALYGHAALVAVAAVEGVYNGLLTGDRPCESRHGRGHVLPEDPLPPGSHEITA